VGNDKQRSGLISSNVAS